MRSEIYLVMVLAACAAEPQPPAPARAVPQATTPAADARPLRPPALASPASPPGGIHGADIVALSVTGDGGAAATLDRLGALRLWPTLDGTHEPIVIHSTAARSLAIDREPDGFAIGVIDAAGGVSVLRTTTTGVVRGRASVAHGQPALTVATTHEGMLVLYADQVVELVDATGAVRSRLVPEPGTHIASLLVRGDRALALVQEDRKLRGRWIVLDHGARWGTDTAAFATKVRDAVLSPAGDVLAVTRPNHLHPVLIDLATGAPRKTELCVPRGWPGDSVDQDELRVLRSNAPTPIGFVDDRTVACVVTGQLVWWSTEGAALPAFTAAVGLGHRPTVALASAIVDRMLVVGIAESIALVTPNQTRYLGYGMHDVNGMYVGPGGTLVTGLQQQAFLLDGDLRERGHMDLGHVARPEWSTALPLDDRYALTATARRSTGLAGTGELAVFDGVAGAERQVLPYVARTTELAYEPSTRLLATSDGATALLVPLDPVSHTFGASIRLRSAIRTTRIALVDPALARGVVALEIDETVSGLLIGEIFQADLGAAVVEPRALYRVPGELRAVDRAGRLYVHPPDRPDDVVVYTRGVAGVRLPGVAEATLVPSGDGQLIAAFHAPRLTLMTAAGATRWTAAYRDSAEVAWTAAGELVARFPLGLGKIDLASGALAERHCGWGFGLSDQPTAVSRSGTTVCDAVSDAR